MTEVTSFIAVAEALRRSWQGGLGGRCVSREHPCAIDSHRIRDHYRYTSLYPASFSGWRTKFFSVRKDPTPWKQS